MPKEGQKKAQVSFWLLLAMLALVSALLFNFATSSGRHMEAQSA